MEHGWFLYTVAFQAMQIYLSYLSIKISWNHGSYFLKEEIESFECPKTTMLQYENTLKLQMIHGTLHVLAYVCYYAFPGILISE